MKKMSNKKMIIISVAVVSLAGLLVFVGGKLLLKNDNHAATVTPTPVVIVTPVASPSVSPEVTVSPEVSKDPSEGDKPTATPSAKPSVKPSVKPSATPKPTPKPTTKPTATPTTKPTATPTPVPPAPKPEEKPVLCSADGANPELACDVLVGNYEGMTMFEGDDADMTLCKAWGEERNNDQDSTHSRYFCTQAKRNDDGIWGSGGMLVY